MKCGVFKNGFWSQQQTTEQQKQKALNEVQEKILIIKRDTESTNVYKGK